MYWHLELLWSSRGIHVSSDFNILLSRVDSALNFGGHCCPFHARNFIALQVAIGNVTLLDHSLSVIQVCLNYGAASPTILLA